LRPLPRQKGKPVIAELRLRRRADGELDGGKTRNLGGGQQDRSDEPARHPVFHSHANCHNKTVVAGIFWLPDHSDHGLLTPE
jgi:hypothetical protein